MLRLSSRTLKSRILTLAVCISAAAFILLVPIGEDVSFDRLGSREKRRYYRNGTDITLSLPIRFRKPSRAALPPLPEFNWNDILLSRSFRTNLSRLFSKEGFPVPRSRFFAMYIGVSTAAGIESNTFYFNWQYNSGDFTFSDARILFTNAAAVFSRALHERKISTTPGKKITALQAGYPGIVISLGLIKIRHIFIPLLLYFMLRLFLAGLAFRNGKIGRILCPVLPPVLTLAVFFLFFLPWSRIPVYTVTILLFAANIIRVRKSGRSGILSSLLPLPKAAGMSLILLFSLYLVQIERLTAPSFHETSDRETLLFQKVRLTEDKTPVGVWPYPPASLPESTLFQKKLLEQERGPQDASIMRMVLANPLYRCRLARGGSMPGVPEDRGIYFVMECSRRMISRASGKPVDSKYLTGLFGFYRDNFIRFLARENRLLATDGKVVLREDLPEVPLPLELRALVAFALLTVFMTILLSLSSRKTGTTGADGSGQ